MDQHSALRTQNPEPSDQHSPSRLLIVNADDFGISEGVNRAILEAHQRGILTSTTAMANMPSFEHAAQLALEHPTLGVGVHLNLTTGNPLLPRAQVPTLVGDEGRLLPMSQVVRGLTFGRLDHRQMEMELSAQVEKMMEAGLRITHLDSHHHLHVHPVLQPIAVRIALRYGIWAIRCPVEFGLGETMHRAGMLLASTHHPEPRTQSSEPSTRHPSVPSPQSSPESPRSLYLKTMVLTLLGRLLRMRARRAGLATPDHFRGLLLGVAFSTRDLHGVLLHLPEGTTELMCHPGYPDEQLRQWTSYSAGRDSELEALMDPGNRGILEQVGARLGSYSDLGS